MLSVINTKPLILTIDNFISSEQCSKLLKFNWNWQRSQGWSSRTNSTNFTDIRTSSTVFAYLSDSNMPKELEFISTKLSQVFDISSLRLEPPQLTRYEPDQFYKDHWDYFFDENLQGNNRVITAIVYLNDDFTGGNTTFPLLNISIAPKVGRLLYFMYDYDSDINQLTKHSGDTVTSGVKQIVTIWIRKTKWPL